MTYDSRFRWAWLYVLTVILAIIISSSIKYPLLSNLAFLTAKTCGIQASFLVFQSKSLLQARKNLVSTS